MGKVADFISEHITVVRTLQKAGKVPVSVMSQFEIYNRFLALESTTPKRMDRYVKIADSLGINDRIVMRAVKEMESPIQQVG